VELFCPECKARIDPQNVNVRSDLAKCTACNGLFAASELAREASAKSLRPPPGTKILFTSRGEAGGVFEIPRMAGNAVGALLFCAVWLGFVGLFTYAAVQAGQWVALLFSVPFWLVGIGIFSSGVNGLFERQFIEFTSREISIRKRRPFFPQRVEIPLSEIDWVSLGGKGGQTADNTAAPPCPVISHGVKKTTFAENVSEAEKQWLVNVLKAFIARRKGAAA